MQVIIIMQPCIPNHPGL